MADELGVEVYESAPAPSPAAPAPAPPPIADAAPAPAAAPAPSAAAPSAAAAPDAAFLESVAAAARDKIKVAHAMRVRGLLQTVGDRLLFGRNNPEQALKKHEIAMNAAARELLEADPELVRFDEAIPRTGPLIEAARIRSHKSYAFAKAKGSRAQGTAGIVGARVSYASSSRSASSGGAGPSGGASSSSSSGGASSLSSSSRVTPVMRSARMGELPAMIKDAASCAQNARDASDQARVRKEFEKALEFSSKAEVLASKEARLRVELSDLSKADSKAALERGRLLAEQEKVASETPTMTALLWENMRGDLPGKATTLAETMKSSHAFSRQSSMSSDGTLRVSPIDASLTLEDFILIKTKFCHDLGHGDKCRCRVLIAAAAILAKLATGDRITVKNLWKESGGSSSVTLSQPMLDQLVYMPMVAFRRSDSSIDSNSAWMITCKESDVDYLRLGPMMKALQPATVLSATPRSVHRATTTTTTYDVRRRRRPNRTLTR